MASSFTDTLGKFTKNVKEKAQSLTDKQELLQGVRNKEKQQTQLFTELGRAFFTAHEGDAEGEFQTEIAMLRTLKAEIAEAEEKIAALSGACVCPACNQTVPAESKFCPACGAPMVKKAPEDEAGQKADTVLCPACGKPVRADALFCTACGARMK